MQTFEFMYGYTWFKYECGYIHRQNSFGHWTKYCPVLSELEDKLSDFAPDQQKTIMEAIIHGYIYGISDGKYEKIREIKRMLDID